MRRPVKPFVTEYRGGSRRQPGQGQTSKSDPFGKTDPFKEPEPRVAEAWPEPPPIVPYAASQQQEDSYEAALRAADSLFAGVRHADFDKPEPSDDTSLATHPSGGRVLRAVDESPSHEMQEMMRLEAEFAPKKRGRKPGSKNKPKPAALVADWVPPATAAERRSSTGVEPASAETHDRASAGGAAAAGTIIAKVAGARPVAARPALAHSALAGPAAARTVAALAQEAGSAGPRGERYAWVRTRLKPGQQWKKRLPKVAW